MAIRKTLTKVVAFVIAAAFVITGFNTVGPGLTKASAAEGDYKFKVQVSSESASAGTGAVTGTVYEDFTADLTITGDKVNTSNVSVDVWMKNVQSLGISGERHYQRGATLSSGGSDVNLANNVAPIFNKFIGTSVIGKIGDKSVTYSVSKDADGTYHADPDAYANANAVWHALVNDDTVAYGTEESGDGYLSIANGATIEAGNSILQFEEDYNSDLLIDDVGNISGLNSAIRDAVELKTIENGAGADKVIMTVPAGTTLKLGQTYATLKKDLGVTVKSTGIGESVEDALEAFRDASGTPNDIMRQMLGLLDAAATKISESKSVEVVFEYEHDWDVSYEWSADNSACTATAVCKYEDSHILTETVDTTCEVVKPVSGGAAGEYKYTASFTNTVFEEQTKSVAIDPDDYKFILQVSSTDTHNKKGAVTGTVYPDFTAKLTFEGDNVNTSNVSADVWMKDVASLGVEGVRHHALTINTGMSSRDVPMSNVTALFDGFTNATVTAKCGKATTIYAIVNNGTDITATPDKNASKVWHAIVNDDNFASGTKQDEDSSATVAKGSYIQIGEQILNVDDTLAIDNLSNLSGLEETIRDAVSLKDAEEAIENVEIFLDKGTRLEIGSSFAELKKELLITVDGVDLEVLSGTLNEMQAAEGTDGMVKAALKLFGDLLAAMDGNNAIVTFEFGHKLNEVEAVAATCEEAGNNAYYECEICGKFFSDAAGETEITKEDTVIAATGHNWGAATYVWANDYSMVEGTIVCENDPAHVIKETTKNITSEETPATTQEAGKITYTATFTNPQFTDAVIEVPLDAVDYKFQIDVSSETQNNGTGRVTGTVYPDFTADLVVNGTYVNPSNVTVGVYMKDVASLGVEGVRSYVRTINTGLTHSDVALSSVQALFDNLNNAQIKAVCGDKTTVYTLNNDKNGKITATPDNEEYARGVWHAIVNEENIESGVQGDDSYATIAKGSYIQIGGELLKVDEELKIDNLNDLDALEEAIRGAVSLTEAEAIENIEIFLDKDTVLAVGSSFAKLKKEVKITIDADAAAFEGALADLRDTTGGTEFIKKGLQLFGDVLTEMDGRTTTVTFEFGHKPVKVDAVPATCEDAGTIEYYECEICGRFFSDEACTTELKAEDLIAPAAGHKLSKIAAVPATCEEAGTIEYYQCDVCGKLFADEAGQTEITDDAALAVEAIGHKWGAATYVWANDYSMVEGTIVCENDPAHVIKETTKNITSEETPATTQEAGKITYTATFTNPQFTDAVIEVPLDAVDYKFQIDVSSETQNNGTGRVTGTVYPDFTADLVVNGTYVNPSNVTVGVYMKDVASLGVEGVRSYVRTINTGLTHSDVALSSVQALFDNLNNAQIKAVCGDKTTVYTLNNDKNGKITATPDNEEYARGVWHAIVNEENIESGVQGDDSYATIAKGSYIQIGGELLKVDEELKIDNLNDLDALEEAIRGAVSLTEAEAIENIEIFLDKDTVLAVGSSFAKLKKEVKITIDADAAAFEGALADLRDTTGGTEFIKKGLQLFGDVLTEMDGKTTTVTFEFGHKPVKVDAVPATCEKAGTIEYYECEICGRFFSDEECTTELKEEDLIAPAAGHKLSKIAAVPATCEKAGTIEYYQCDVCGKLFADEAGQTEITDEAALADPATGHKWGEPTYEWADDNSTVTATAICENNAEHKLTETVNTTMVITEATTFAPGSVTYYADFENELFEQQKKTIEGEAIDYKFILQVSSKDNSGNVGAVTGTVYPDYTAKLAFTGDNVNTSNVSADVWMKNVASLGVDGVRHHALTINTGLTPRDVPMSNVKALFDGFTNATVTAKCGKAMTVYAIVNNGTDITATPDKNASKVWHAIVNEENIESGTKDTEDSSASVAKGSYIQIGEQILNVDDELKIDNLNDLSSLETTIRDAVSLTDADEAIENVEIFLDKGTRLDVGSSYAELKKEVKITVDGVDMEVLAGTLDEMQAATGTDGMVKGALKLVGDLLAAMDGNNAIVTFEFGHKMTEVAAVEATCEEAGIKAHFECEVCGRLYEDEAGTTEVTKEDLAVEALGHDYQAVVTEADCYEGGYTTYTCSRCGDEYVADETAALGHDWGEPTYEWADDNSTVTAKAVCSRNPAHILTETVNTTMVITEATTFAPGSVTYYADFENELFEQQKKTIEGEAIDYKFILQVSSKDNSGNVGAVTGTVYPDYTAKLAFTGDNVNTSNVSADVWMKNVASLGVDGVRHHALTINTGLTPRDVPMSNVKALFDGFTNATVTAKCGKAMTVYAIVNNGTDITATPDKNASKVWHAIVNEENIESGTKDTEDSSATVAKGSYIQIGGQILSVDDELKIDNLNDLSSLETTIRDAVSLTDADEAIENVEIFLDKGTRLDVGSSYAELKKEVKITVDGVDMEVLAGTLDEMQAATGTDGMVKGALKLVGDLLAAMDGNNAIVTFEFGHKMTEVAAVEATCEEDGIKAHFECEICGRLYEDEAGTTEVTKEDLAVEALGHDYKAVVTEPTCTESGYTTYTCSRCGDEYVADETEALGHDYQAVVTEADCYEGGYTTYTCSRCGDEYVADETAALGHDWGEPTYEWADDNSTVTATVICENNAEHKLTETVNTTMVITEATTFAPGSVTYYADFENELFEQQKKTIEGEAIDYKFILQVSSKDNSGNVGAVTGTVYPDYTAKLAFTGDNVNTSNVSADVWMKNVASLGVDGVRHHALTINTGLTPRDVPMSNVKALFDGFTNATVTAKCGKAMTVYAIVNNGTDITATPDKNASKVWHAIVNEENIESGTKDTEDSSATVAKGSYIQIGGQILSVDDELKIDNLNDLSSLETTIRDAVSLTDADEEIENVEIFLDKGTRLDVGSSYAELKKEVKITVDGVDMEVLAGTLDEMQAATGTDGMVKGALKLVGDLLAAMDGNNAIVTFEFGHKMTEVAAVEATCEEDGIKAHFECEICGRLYEDEAGTTELTEEDLVDPAIGHKWCDPVWDWADDFSSATATFTCENDDTHVIEITTEDITSEPIKEPTCLAAGETAYTATVTLDGKEYTGKESETTEALGHDMDEGIVTTEPTCDTEGEITYSCSRCDYEEHEAVPAKGHDWGDWTKVNDATHQRICKNDATHIESGAHAWEETARTEPTGNAEGSVTYTCAFCGAEKTETLPMVVDKTELYEAISTAVDDIASTFVSEDGLDVNPEDFWVTQDDVDALTEAVNEALEKAATEGITQDEVDAATKALLDAIEAFDAAKQPGQKPQEVEVVDKTALQAAIDNAVADLVDTIISEDGSDVDPADVWASPDEADALTDAIKEAMDVLADPEATQEEVDAATKAMNDAIDAFDAGKEPGKKKADKTALEEAIVEATQDAEETNVSEDGSDIPQDDVWVTSDEKAALDKAIEDALEVFNDPDATQEEVDAAKEAVEAAKKAFDDAKKAGTKVIPLTKIKITPTACEMATLSDFDPSVVYTPADATDKELVWTSSDPTIASVDQNGTITAHIYGKEVTITATAKNNPKVKASIKVQTRYWDVMDPSEFYYTAVYWAADNKITKEKVQFNPADECTRKTVILFMYRLAGSPAVSGKTGFPDVDGVYGKNSDTYKAILWGSKNGIVKGYPNGKFGGEDTVTRKQVMIMLYRMNGKPAVSGKMTFTDVADKYKPKSDTYKAILWGTNFKLTNGYSDGTFRPGETCLRRQIVYFIYKYDFQFNSH